MTMTSNRSHQEAPGSSRRAKDTIENHHDHAKGSGWIVHPGTHPNELTPENLAHALEAIEEHGFVLLPRFFSREHLELFTSKLISHTQTVMSDLRSSGVTIDVGSKAGFKEIVLRSPGRFDVPIDLEEFEQIGRLPFQAIIDQILGNDAVGAFCGVVVSEPDSPAQHWHADSLHLSEEHTPANLLNLLVSLHDISLEMGPTELVPGTHVLTNHHMVRVSEPITTDIVYQHPQNSPELLGSAHQPFCMAMPAGSVLIFDDRILHRGLANQSKENRYVGYFSYRRKLFEANTHFEATRSLYS